MVLLAVLGSLALPAAAGAAPATFVYWTNAIPGSIGRANLDGTGVDQAFITSTFAHALAVDDKYIYWSQENSLQPGGEPGGDTIARARLDGSGVEQDWILPDRISTEISGLAVDATHIYWSGGDAETSSIGRANLDGSAENSSFITGIYPTGVAVDAGHVYWSDQVSDTVGRANIDGTGADPAFITGPGVPTGVPTGVAVDAGHVYWSDANVPSSTVGRANIDGTGADPAFIPEAGSPTGLAVDTGHLYWADTNEGRIGRVNLDGTGVDQSFITGASIPFGVAIGGGGSPSDGSTVLSFKKTQKLSRSHNYLLVKASCSAPCESLRGTGTVKLGSRKIGKLTKTTKAANGSSVALKLKLPAKVLAKALAPETEHKTATASFKVAALGAGKDVLGARTGTVRFRRKFF